MFFTKRLQIVYKFLTQICIFIKINYLSLEDVKISSISSSCILLTSTIISLSSKTCLTLLRTDLIFCISFFFPSSSSPNINLTGTATCVYRLGKRGKLNRHFEPPFEHVKVWWWDCTCIAIFLVIGFLKLQVINSSTNASMADLSLSSGTLLSEQVAKAFSKCSNWCFPCFNWSWTIFGMLRKRTPWTWGLPVKW